MNSKRLNVYKNKVGFTLIELLAVIVILAIVALISTPIIIGVIDKARKGAFEDSAYGVLDAGRIYFIDKLADDNNFTGVTFAFPDGGDLKLSGEKPAGGTLSLDEDGNQALALYDKEKKWCAYKKYMEEKIEITDYKNSHCTTTIEAPLKGIVKDLSGKNNDGMIYGDSTIRDTGITFYGAGFVDAGYAGYDFKDGFTFVARFKINEAYADNVAQSVLGNWEGAGGGLAVIKGTEPYANLYFSEYKRVYSGKNNLDEFHTVAFIYDKNKLILYKDGVKVDELAVSGTPPTSPMPIYVGGNPQQNGTWVESSKITVQDALVMDRPVTEAEVNQYFKEKVHVLEDSHVLFQYKW